MNKPARPCKVALRSLRAATSIGFALSPMVRGASSYAQPSVTTLIRCNQSAYQMMGCCENLSRFLRTKKGEKQNRISTPKSCTGAMTFMGAFFSKFRVQL